MGVAGVAELEAEEVEGVREPLLVVVVDTLRRERLPPMRTTVTTLGLETVRWRERRRRARQQTHQSSRAMVSMPRITPRTMNRVDVWPCPVEEGSVCRGRMAVRGGMAVRCGGAIAVYLISGDSGRKEVEYPPGEEVDGVTDRWIV